MIVRKRLVGGNIETEAPHLTFILPLVLAGTATMSIKFTKLGVICMKPLMAVIANRD